MRRKRNRIHETKYGIEIYPPELRKKTLRKIHKLVKSAKPIKIKRYLDDIYDDWYIQTGMRYANLFDLGIIDLTIRVYFDNSASLYVITEVNDSRHYSTKRIETAAKIIKSIIADKREGMNAVKSATRVNLMDISRWY